MDVKINVLRKVDENINRNIHGEISQWKEGSIDTVLLRMHG